MGAAVAGGSSRFHREETKCSPGAVIVATVEAVIMSKPLVLWYAGCNTCRKALAWLDQHKVEYTLRPIVEEPPTRVELAKWIPMSGKPVRKWLNTSGQSYRALGKAKVAAADETTLVKWLNADGKLVKRPVLIAAGRVLVGFDPDEYADVFKK
jgi:arsenate reductase